jgi:hypothetical protein
MARIPDDLIVFLIGEIASSGQHGESFPSSSGMRQICPIVPVGESPQLAIQTPPFVSQFATICFELLPDAYSMFTRRFNNK